MWKEAVVVAEWGIYPGVFWVGPRINVKNISQDIRCINRECELVTSHVTAQGSQFHKFVFWQCNNFKYSQSAIILIK